MSLETIRTDLASLRAQQQAAIAGLWSQMQSKVTEHQAMCAAVSEADAVGALLAGIEAALDERAAELSKRAALAGNLASHRTIRRVVGFDGEGLPLIEARRPAPDALRILDQASALDLLAVVKPVVWGQIEAWAGAAIAAAGTPGVDDLDALCTAADATLDELIKLLDQLRQARAELAALPAI